MPQLTPHISLSEMTVTEVRPMQARNLALAQVEPVASRLLATAVLLEEVRTLCGGHPIVVHSGFRYPELNTHIGGNKASQHMKGEAADFHVVGVPLRMVFDTIRRSLLRWGQLILEDGDGDGVPTWVHISQPDDRHSQQVLTFDGHDYHTVV